MPVEVSDFKRLPNNNIRAFFSLELPAGVIIDHCILKYSEDTRRFSVPPPQIPVVTQNGSLSLDKVGQMTFDAALTLRRTRTRQHFESTALTELRRVASDLFEPRRPQASNAELLDKLTLANAKPFR